MSHATYAAAVGSYCLYRLYRYAEWKQKNTRIMKLAKDTREKRDSKIWEFKLDGVDVDKILGLNVVELREGLIDGEFKSVDLVNVFGERSYRIGRVLNLSAEENFGEALKMAAEKDLQTEEARRRETLSSLPILHGIPFSVKD